MVALLTVLGGTTGSALVSGWFGSRQARLTAQTTSEQARIQAQTAAEARLWERIADLEKRAGETADKHNDQIRALEAEHRKEVLELKTEIHQLETLLETKNREILQLQADLRAAQLEIQVVRIQQQTGAGSQVYTPAPHSSGQISTHPQ